MFGGGEVSLRDELRMCSAERTVVATKVSLRFLISHILTQATTQYEPKEGREHNRSDSTAIESTPCVNAPVRIAPAHRNRNESREPENHGNELDSRDGELVRELREACRNEEKISHCEQCPEGREKHEVDAGGRPAVAIVVVSTSVLIDDWRC